MDSLEKVISQSLEEVDTETDSEEDTEENTVLTTFFGNFLDYMERNIIKTKATWVELSNLNEKMWTDKDKHLEKIFTNICYGNRGEILAKRLLMMSRVAQTTLESTPHQVEETKEKFRSDFKKWTESVEQSKQNTLVIDNVTRLPYAKVEAELQELLAETKVSQDQHDSFKLESKDEIEQLQAKLQQMQKEHKIFEELAIAKTKEVQLLADSLNEKRKENDCILKNLVELNNQIEELKQKLKQSK